MTEEMSTSEFVASLQSEWFKVDKILPFILLVENGERERRARYDENLFRETYSELARLLNRIHDHRVGDTINDSLQFVSMMDPHPGEGDKPQLHSVTMAGEIMSLDVILDKVDSDDKLTPDQRADTIRDARRVFRKVRYARRGRYMVPEHKYLDKMVKDCSDSEEFSSLMSLMLRMADGGKYRVVMDRLANPLTRLREFSGSPIEWIPIEDLIKDEDLC